MALPIFFVHTGNSYYLKYALKQARLFNPESEIILLGDESNNKYDFLKHYHIKDYHKSADHFASVFKNFSTNSIEFELFCFQRWFIINEFIDKHKDEFDFSNGFICLDSDVLLFCDVTSTLISRQMCAIGTSGKDSDDEFNCYSPHNTFFKMPDILASFCLYCQELYEKHLNRLEAFDQNFRARFSQGGVSDMLAFCWFVKDKQVSCTYMNEIKDQTTFIHNLKQSENFKNSRFGNIKVYWIKGIPHACCLTSNQKIRLNAIHLQGGNKTLMPLYYSGKKDLTALIYAFRQLMRVLYHSIT